MKAKIPESMIVKACLSSLERAGVFHYRNNTGAFRGEYKGKRRFVRFGAPGAPDIIAVYRGRCIGIECKRSGGRPSEAQRRFGAALEAAGGVYIVVSDTEEAAKIGMSITTALRAARRAHRLAMTQHKKRPATRYNPPTQGDQPCDADAPAISPSSPSPPPSSS